MDTVYAANGSSGGGGWAGLIPLLLIGVIWGLVLKPIAKRKGKNEWLWFFAGLVPMWNVFGGLWLASLPDKSLVETVNRILDRLQKSDYWFKEEGTKAGITSPKVFACEHCGAEYKPQDYSQDASEWLCPQCAKPLPKPR